MRDSAFGPVTISPDFWSHPNVTRALANRDIGELFRLLRQRAGLSQTRIGASARQSPCSRSWTTGSAAPTPGVRWCTS